MKVFNLHRFLVSSLSVAIVFMSIAAFNTQPANAQSDAKQFKRSTEPIQYSSDELEALRSKLLEVVDTVKDFSDTLKPGDIQASNNLSLARTQIEQFSTKQLTELRGSLDPSKMNVGLENARAVLNDFKPAIQAYYARHHQTSDSQKAAYMENSTAFPAVEGPDAVCEVLVGSGRPSAALAIAADAVYMAAKIADVVLSRGCEQVAVAVVLGEGGGGNGSLLCVISDGVLLAAEVVRDKIGACDDDYSKRAIDASLARLEHLHTDLDNSIANDNANKTTITGAVTTATTTITGAVTTATTTITGNDNTNKNTIVTAISNSQGAIVDNANGNTTALTTAISNTQTSIINNDNTNKNTIVANDNTNKNTIVANDNANAAALTNLLLRLQIEADLAAADSSTPVALFMTPSTTCGLSAPLNQCGLLGLVRQILVQTISNLAGTNTSQANAYLAKGDVYRNAGNYAAAYQQYRQAYKSAAK